MSEQNKNLRSKFEASIYALSLSEINDMMPRLVNLHRIVGSHHSSQGIRNAIIELEEAQRWLKLHSAKTQ